MIINFSDEEVRTDYERRIFLAGPTRRNSIFEKSWRKKACKILENLDFDGIVYVPEFSSGAQFDYTNQVLWERKALESATKILFWVPRNIKDGMPAFTTNVEFGMYLARNPEKVILAYPETAEKMSYLEWLYNYETGRCGLHNLENALEHIVESLNERI